MSKPSTPAVPEADAIPDAPSEDTSPDDTDIEPHVKEYLDRVSEYDKINLGCGADIREDYLNVDIVETHEPNIVWDLEDTPWPWPTNSFKVALVDNVLEHIAVRKRTAFIEECHRILEPGGTLVLRLPVPEVGIGWDETHYPIPSWKVLEHSRWRDRWKVQSYEGKRVGAGRLLPERAARLATRQWLRCVDEVTVEAMCL